MRFVFLKSLTLKGFKSFADPATLELEPGVTVVVGPNGSGKSNIVDAIAWVLGAQAPSTVRSQKMDDVIFAGTARRPALGRAEVALTIDNSAGLLPLELSEVTITRTLFRTGESEYAINGVPSRLLDVQELLSDAGVGRQQHVIVSQGQIDAVLNARPEERRLIVEEAAGVLKYRRRKEKAERRLEATEANLLRVQDLLREVRRQLRPLQRQAEAAQRHGALVADLTAVRLHLAGRELAALRGRLAAAAGQRATLAADERALKASLAELDARVLACEAELSGLGGTDLGDALARLEALRERARGLGAVLVERHRTLERERGALMDQAVVATLEAEAARLAAELAEVEAEAEALVPRAAELAEAEAALAADRAGFEAAGVAAVAPPSGRAAEVRGELAALRDALGRADAELGRVQGRLAALDGKAQRLAAEAERLRAQLRVTEAAELPLVAELEQAEARRITAEATAEAAEAARRAAERERHSGAARVEALALALDQARARAGAERLAEVDGVLGTLLDLVEVDEGWEAAFEAAAGEALAAVVVEDPGAARRALGALDAGGAAGAVLAAGRGPLGSGPSVAAAGGVPVRAHVRASRAGVAALLDALLGAAVVVDGGWVEALDAALAHPGVVVVTRAGDRFGPGGWRLGAGGGGATRAALEEAEQRADAAAHALVVAEQAVAAARAELTAARAAEADVARRLDDNDGRLTAAADALARLSADQRDVGTETEALRSHLHEVAGRAERERRRMEELEQELPALEADEGAAAEQARAAAAARSRLDERAAAVGALRTDLEVRAAGLDERRQYLRRRLDEVEQRLQHDTEQRHEAELRRRRLDQRLVALDRLAAVVAGHATVVDGELTELRDRRRRQSEAARVAAEGLDRARRERLDTERRLEELRERSRRGEIEEAETRLRLEAAVETLRRELDVDPDVAIASPCPDLAEGVSPAARARELDRELKLLGPINPLALEEYTALEERHAFLEAQLEDVRSTRRDLARVIRAVDAEIVSVFTAAYADVAANFEQLFQTLFPGGSGSLRLTDPEDLLDTGIEVEARPSGKNVRKLSLLSGGERSLTALAFLFAVFRSRPSPFYVMDEVEAALDDVNLHRFLDLVHEFRDEAQLLIVSHQKRTMEAADCLFGVTMQPGGSSRVVSERVASPA
ncbi:MAG: chromosome segregation protein SMC [Acidimicrobiales bacterium]|nr:chromosome segregation protein SMC [Acidimicrobiales bacterium]